MSFLPIAMIFTGLGRDASTFVQRTRHGPDATTKTLLAGGQCDALHSETIARRTFAGRC